MDKVERLQESITLGKSKLDDLKEKEEGAYEREDESDKKSSFTCGNECRLINDFKNKSSSNYNSCYKTKWRI